MGRLIIFSGTVGFRHTCIDATVRAIGDMAKENAIPFVATDDSTIFTEQNLNDALAVVWAHTSGTGLLDATQRSAYEGYTARGGGFAGIHAASDCERDWALFDELVGARFRSHPTKRQLQTATVTVERPDDPSVSMLPAQWRWTDEWYAFDRNPRADVEVLLTVDEGTYDPEDSSMGADHPIAWRSKVGAARTWYTSLGHEPTTYENSMIRSHLWAGISSVIADDHQLQER
ncbi:Type 1 glutamine amidotransferase (GATase1) [Ruania alba]|uniref:Type 1 glutamine amidotransferase (GATase1) n=1 Tax=Ruania alba TaxID=648782 RepID=A0A1H5MIS9_9MICO|nr:Type 1 glutamine amidotransferase (GATase1) [Ruania alba]